MPVPTPNHVPYNELRPQPKNRVLQSSTRRSTRLRSTLRLPPLVGLAVTLTAALGIALMSPWHVERAAAAGGIIISEVAPWSSGNTPLSPPDWSDWFEVTNTTGSSVNMTGWKMEDSSGAFATAAPLTGITTIAAGESVIFMEIPVGAVAPNDLATRAAQFRTLWFGATPPSGLQIGGYSAPGVGLSTGGDGVQLFDGSGTVRAAVTFAASPGGPFPTFLNAAGLEGPIAALSVAGAGGAFTAAGHVAAMGSPGVLGTQAVASPIRLNEVESSDGAPGDWVEFYNTGAASSDLSGYLFRDSNNANTYTLPAGTVVAAGAYFVLEQAQFGFQLDGVDSARLLTPSGSVVVDSRAWLEHSSATYGRCPNGSGAFTTTLAPTKGAANSCPSYAAWSGGAAVQTADAAAFFGENMSGLAFEKGANGGPDVLWAVRNGPETLFRLLWDATNQIWSPDSANGWSTGKQMRYPGGAGDATSRPDSEGLTYTSLGSSDGIYVATERNNGASGVSRPAILRVDPTSAGSELVATDEWVLTNDLPALGANLGPEAITWIPDAFLLARGFIDERTSAAYQPGNYPGHGSGLFFVGIEASGFIYAYALQPGGVFARIGTIDSGFPGIMELAFDRELQDLWAVCDNTCAGRTHLLRVEPSTGKFVVTQRYDRPGGMPNLNNEGFTVTTQADCVNGRKPAYWADDAQTDGHALRSGTVPCLGLSRGPLAADDCKGGDWQLMNFPGRFKTQGDCVSYVNTKAENGPAGQ